jgi:UDP-N-acetylglucosamine transferase subunit ALG13
MIIVSLGTHERNFFRLVKEIERLIQEKKIKEKIIIQLGHTKYYVKGAVCYNFIPFNKMIRYIKESSVMITHGGVGSIMDALSFGKVPIVVPRRKYLDEHSDDHQMQITREMEKQGLIIPVYDINDLENAIKRAKKLKIEKRKKEMSKILSLIDKKLNQWGKK